MLFCSTNELRQSAVDSLEESRSPATTIKVPNFFQFKSEQISIFTCVFCTHNNLWYTSYRHTSYRHNYLVICTIYTCTPLQPTKCYITISLNSGLNDSSVMDFICIFISLVVHTAKIMSCSCSALNADSNDTKIDKK